MNKKNTILTLMAVFTVAMLLVPQGAAQTQRDAQFSIEGVSQLAGQIKPDIEPQQTTVNWKYNVIGAGGQVGFAENTAATLQWEKPDCTDNTNILVSGPSTQTIGMTAQDTEKTGNAKFQISATTLAPGEQQLKCTFAGKVLAVGSAIKETNTAEQDLLFSVAYYGLIQAKSSGRLKEAPPQKTISYDVEVTNFGNAQTAVAFTLGTEKVGSWKPIVPEPLILESKISGLGGDVQQATFQISTPFKNGWNNDEQTFKLVLTPTSAKTGAEGGNPVEVNVLARVRGVYVPSLEPFVMVGAILGAAMLARLKREE